jgi:hypothetical protein
MAWTIRRADASARLAALLTLLPCLVVLAWAAPAAAGPTRTIKAPPKKIGDTTCTSETTEENFGTAAKPDWRRVETRETSETPRSGQSTTVDREITIRKYEGGSKRATETTTITEVEQPVFNLEPTVKSRTTKTTTYGTVGRKRKKVKEVEESWQVVEVTERGEVFATGKRVTKTFGPGGTTTKTETLNPKTGQWQVVKTPSGKNATSSSAPLGAQRQGLPTANPGQRGMVPDVPSQPKPPSSKY